jgi:tetratricopeptide (TPR) repeat protein
LIAFGICWFFLNLLIESTVIPIDLVFEQRLYLPSIGFYIAGISGFEECLRMFRNPLLRRLGILACAAILVFEGYHTRIRNREWNSEELLWKQITERFPDQPRAHFFLGILYEKTNRLSEAETEYARAAALRPLDYSAHNNYANLLIKKGEPQKALEEYVRAIAIDPDAVEASVNIGKVLASLGKPDLGIKALENYLLKHPRPQAYEALGEIYLSQNNVDSARQVLEKADDLDPGNVGRLATLAMLSFTKGDREASERYYQRAIRIAPASEELHRALGAVYESRRWFDRALDEYRKVLEINPDNRFVHYQIGKLYQEEGRLQDAVSEYELAVKRNPLPDAISLLQQLSLRIQDPRLRTRISRLIRSAGGSNQ